jgi:hypothetical protein
MKKQYLELIRPKMTFPISEAPFILICTFHQHEGYTKHEWTTFTYLPHERKALKNAMEVFLEFVKRHQISKHLIDTQNGIGLLDKEDWSWITGEILPKATEYGLKYLANVIPRDCFFQFPENGWGKKNMNDLIIQDFAREQDAINWFKKL